MELFLKLNREDTFPDNPLLESNISQVEDPGNFLYFPLNWLIERIEHLLDSPTTEPIRFPEDTDIQSNYRTLINQNGLTSEEEIILCLVLTCVFAPETIATLAHAARDNRMSQFTGGIFLNGNPIFQPTVRTALFILAGRDLEKRAHYATLLHHRLSVFTSGIIIAHQTAPNTSFMDHRLVFSDQFLGTILNGNSPRLEGDPTFPVKKSAATHSLSDVILKEETKSELDKLRRFAKNMHQLWKIDPKRKVRNNFISIFSGDPGTGKSHAAEAVGNEFGLPVYKVNFAQMVSKYIGETEKNLEKVFDRFDRQPCILFFDEAESIFSKRTDVTDSHDQHANNLQSYLLQKVEEFSGIIILATNVHNLSQYFDKAFQRRFRLIVNFEFPDYAERLQLWNQSLFPPYIFEEGLTEKLALNYQLSGGSIYNIVSDAIITALDTDTEIVTFELLDPALKDEFKKTSRKYEICLDEMVRVNPARRFGPNYEQRRNF